MASVPVCSSKNTTDLIVTPYPMRMRDTSRFGFMDVLFPDWKCSDDQVLKHLKQSNITVL